MGYGHIKHGKQRHITEWENSWAAQEAAKRQARGPVRSPPAKQPKEPRK